MQEVTVKAVNRILTDSNDFLRQMQENIAKVIMAADTMSPDSIQTRLEELQKAHREDHRLCRPLHRGIQARHHNRHRSIKRLLAADAFAGSEEPWSVIPLI
ncbi:hypothetical protein [Bifidobacterium thermacidophilum]|uniref:hypothetical protein n=1 Tax=Bifidobacterium thermacidophilum TaxID=246618 RepID=UPI0026F33A30|nr:hypothetical protein [Bifidobacterium thermacidophilum]